MKLFSFVFFILIFQITEAQNIWKKNYIGVQNGILELNDETYLTSVGTSLFRIDSTGKRIWERDFAGHALNHNSYLDGINKIIKINDFRIAFDAYSIDTCNAQLWPSPGIFVVDTLGNYLNGKHYRLNSNCSEYPVNIKMNNDSGFIEVGLAYPPPVIAGFTKPYIIKVNSDLDLQWAKLYYQYKGGSQFALQAHDNNFIIGFNLDTLGVVISEVDSNGNSIWCKSYFRPKGVIYNIAMNSDGSFVVSGFTDSVNVGLFGTYPPGFDPSMFLMKLDTAGTVLWCKTYKVPTYNNGGWIIRWSDVKTTADGGYILTAAAELNNFAHALMIKTNANGDTLWTRWYGTRNYTNYYEQIYTSKDGGYLLQGITYGTFPSGQQGATFLYKTDSMGHSTCQEHWDTLYTGNLTIHDSDVVLASFDGAIALPAFLIDSTIMPLAEYNSCEITGIDSPQPMTGLEMKLKTYPNPTSGRATLEFENNHKKKSITVFNCIGSIILQKNNITETRYVLDLNTQAKGIYSVNITDGDNKRTIKLAVE